MVSLAKVIGTQIYCWSWIMVSSANFIRIYYYWLGSWCPRHTHCIYIAWIMVSSLFILVYLLLWLGSWCPRHIHLFSQLGSWCPRYLGYLLLWLGSWCPRHIPFIYIAWIMVSSLSILLYYQSVWIMESSPYYNYIVYYLRLQSRPLSLDYYYVFIIRYCVGCCVNVCLCFRADHFRLSPIIADYSRLLWITEDSLVIQFSNQQHNTKPALPIKSTNHTSSGYQQQHNSGSGR